MAEIRKREPQVNALKTIQEELDMIGKINILLDSGKYIILPADQGTSGRARTLSVAIDEKRAAKITSVLAAQKDALRKDILHLAEKFEILLDTEDKAILAGAHLPVKSKKKKEATAQEAAEQDSPVQEPPSAEATTQEGYTAEAPSFEPTSAAHDHLDLSH